ACYDSELRPEPHPRSLDALRTRAAYWGSVVGMSAAEPFMVLRSTR
ncbi:MAG: N-acetylglucosamine malate deacetylase 1, partial [Frankiales bacterium]|nr:N-acetylglucosamine malate deacetylase 1 [Frankiales bacterium]